MRPDQTSFCADCSHRFEAARLCPHCGRHAYTLANSEGRVAAANRLRRLWKKKQKRRQSGPGVAAVVLVAGVALFGLMLIGAVAAVVAVTAAVVVGAAISWRRAHPPVDTGGYPMFRVYLFRELPELSPLTERVTLRGTVRARDTVRAPLSGEAVVAFRVLGSTVDNQFDDAAACTFELIGADDHPVVVEGETAYVDLVPDRAPVEVALDEYLAVYLHDRAVFRPKPPVRLTEAVLRDGDEVEIEGSVTERAAPGYRDSAWQKVVTSSDASPLFIRRPS